MQGYTNNGYTNNPAFTNSKLYNPVKGKTMALERTFSIIKPDATRRNITGQINARLEAAGLRIVAQKRKQLSEAEAQASKNAG